MPRRHLVRLRPQGSRPTGRTRNARIMINPDAWYYLNTGKKKHLIRLEDLAGDIMQSAICGCQILAALPAKARWQADPEGLAVREPCKQCTAILERATDVQGR